MYYAIFNLFEISANFEICLIFVNNFDLFPRNEQQNVHDERTSKNVACRYITYCILLTPIINVFESFDIALIIIFSFILCFQLRLQLYLYIPYCDFIFTSYYIILVTKIYHILPIDINYFIFSLFAD